MLEGAFFLTIFFTDLPVTPYWNPWGPFEFSTYKDCVSAGKIVSGFITHEEYRVTCSSKVDGQVHSEWTSGKAK